MSQSSTIYISALVCVCVCVRSCESAPGGDEGGVVGVCMFLSILTAG